MSPFDPKKRLAWMIHEDPLLCHKISIWHSHYFGVVSSGADLSSPLTKCAENCTQILIDLNLSHDGFLDLSCVFIGAFGKH